MKGEEDREEDRWCNGTGDLMERKKCFRSFDFILNLKTEQVNICSLNTTLFW